MQGLSEDPHTKIDIALTSSVFWKSYLILLITTLSQLHRDWQHDACLRKCTEGKLRVPARHVAYNLYNFLFLHHLHLHSHHHQHPAYRKHQHRHQHQRHFLLFISIHGKNRQYYTLAFHLNRKHEVHRSHRHPVRGCGHCRDR